jgi:small-conductance mechanosensitive channel
MAKIAVRVLGAGLILIAVFGLPSQTSTLIGLTTAGLTVVLKDFIVGFFGWFVLIGSNGIHIGDWVEIEGVGGEVIDIGLLRTVLLEIGNSTGNGHPTGRRVSFVNSFAIEGHYFNFSTSGQWLWDEIQVSLASVEDPYKMADLIGKRIESETENDAKMASQEWERVTHQYGLRPFSAKPAVDLRPSATGIDMVVRYITRAPQRYEAKARLFQAIVELMHKQAPTATAQLA